MPVTDDLRAAVERATCGLDRITMADLAARLGLDRKQHERSLGEILAGLRFERRMLGTDRIRTWCRVKTPLVRPEPPAQKPAIFEAPPAPSDEASSALGELAPYVELYRGTPPISELPTPAVVGLGDYVSAPEPPTIVVQEAITQVEEHRLKQDNARLRADVKRLTAELSDAQHVAEIVSLARDAAPPRILPRERDFAKREATALAMASDWHVEEEVRPEQVVGRNRYNLEISQRRMERFFEATRWAIDFNRQIFTIRDLVLWLGGDFITNYLHPDNVETNLLAPPEALAYVKHGIADGIRFLLEDVGLERILIPCNDGNHGRMTEKMRSAARTQSSLEIFMYRMLADEFSDEPRVEFAIAGGEHVYVEIYDRVVRFAHGDSVRYGGGVGGITIPLYKALARWDTMRRADLTCVGHFHQRIVLPDLMVNSSLIGFSPYSMTIGARYEPPSQNFSILERLRWRAVDLPLWVSERSDDNQNQETT